MSRIIAYADKTVLKISGLNVKGLDTRSLERILTERLGSVTRVIGVTGDSLEMDVYGVPPEQIKRDERGILSAVAAAEGVSLTDLAALEKAERTVAVDFNSIEPRTADSCARERWMKFE